MSGRLIVGIVGQTLTQEEKNSLSHSELFGVILFARNYSHRHQLQALVESIKSINSKLLIFVDQEGAIWRFEPGFTRIPNAKHFGDVYDQQGESVACELAFESARVMASELKAVAIDVTIAPVVDVHNPESVIIGARERAFHANPDVVMLLARAFMKGLKAEGFTPIIKHFPGHGSAVGDTHTQQVIDDRAWVSLRDLDLKPFQSLLESKDAMAVMVGHVIYPAVDDQPAVFSEKWNTLLRAANPDACVFTDCLGMVGVGGWSDRDKCQRALEVGCDVLVYSNGLYRDDDGKATVIPKSIPELLAAVEGLPDITASQARRELFRGHLNA